MVIYRTGPIQRFLVARFQDIYEIGEYLAQPQRVLIL